MMDCRELFFSRRWPILFVALWMHLATFVPNSYAEDGITVPKPVKTMSEEELRQEYNQLLHRIESAGEDPVVLNRAREVYEEVTARAIEPEKRDFVVTGSVVDESGAQIKDVRMTTVERQPVTFVSLKKGDAPVQRDALLADGTFNVKAKRVMSLELHFMKEGYYPEELSVGIPKGNNSALKNAAAKDTVVRDKITVVLMKQGKLVRLSRYRQWLEVSADGSCTVLDFSVAAGQDAAVRATTYKDLKTAGSKSKTTMSILPTIGEDGKIATESHMMSGIGFNGPVEDLPASAAFTIGDPDGGFVRVTSLDIRHFNRSLKEAPRDGYQTSMKLSAAELATRPFFYFKVGEKYGKGRIQDIHTTEDRRKCEMYVECYLQEDGSRNLETARWGN